MQWIRCLSKTYVSDMMSFWAMCHMPISVACYWFPLPVNDFTRQIAAGNWRAIATEVGEWAPWCEFNIGFPDIPRIVGRKPCNYKKYGKVVNPGCHKSTMTGDDF